MADLELVRRFKAGEENAFDEIVRRYRERVYRLAWGFLRDGADAEDLTQEVFVRVYRALPRFREKSSLFTWIYRITLNACRNYATRRRPAHEKERQAFRFSPDFLPEKELLRQELREKLSSAIDTLPKRQKAIFLLRQMEGLSVEEAAKAAGCATGTVKSAYFAAVQRLRTLLEDYVDEV